MSTGVCLAPVQDVDFNSLRKDKVFHSDIHRPSTDI